MGLPPNFAGNDRVDAPWTADFDITPSNSTDLTTPARGLYSGAGGDIAVTLLGNDDGTRSIYYGVPAGVWMPIVVKRVWADLGDSPATAAPTGLKGGI